MSRVRLSILCGAIAIGSLGAAEAGVLNGAMAGEGVDCSDGKGLLVCPPSWMPVNMKPERGDRLAGVPSERPGAGQCLRIKGKATDAGVYQTLAPLEKGTAYLVSAWVKRLSGELEIVAYPQAWGPRLVAVVDRESTGWTQIHVGLTPADGGVHLYIAASKQGEFLVDDVQIRRAAVRVSTPETLPYDLTGSWRYRAQVDNQTGVPQRISVEPVSQALNRPALAAAQSIELAPRASRTVEFRLPFSPVRSMFALRAQDSGTVCGGSALTDHARTPWLVSWPHKNALYASLGHEWPLQVRLEGNASQLIRSLSGTYSIMTSSGQVVRKGTAKAANETLEMPLAAKDVAPGTYRLSLTVCDQSGRPCYEAERPLRVLAPAANEVVCGPDGVTLVNGKRFFPIGMYWVFSNPLDWLPGPARKDADLREMRECGLNALHSYAFEHNDSTDTDEHALAYLDTAQEHGMKVMMGIRRDWYQRERFDLERIEQRVRKLKEHPALLCWTLWDEPNFVANVSLPRVKAMHELIDRVDPYHPAMPVIGMVDNGAFRDCSDAYLFCAYPDPGAAHRVTTLVASAATLAPELPTWYAARAYQWSPGRLPDESTMREYWQRALDAGADAIFWYSYGGSATGWDSVRATPEHWAAFRRANRALADRVAERLHTPGAR